MINNLFKYNDSEWNKIITIVFDKYFVHTVIVLVFHMV